MTLLLLGAAGLSFIIGEAVDGGLIIAIVILNALFGIYQEAKAEESIAALKKMSVAKVRVLRDGVEQEITSNLVVPGDICIVEEGVKIAADGILLESRNIELNESALTGESLPVAKQKGEEVFSGTIVSKGRGVIQVTHTGMQTKFGHIAHELSTIIDTETPLQKKTKRTDENYRNSGSGFSGNSLCSLAPSRGNVFPCIFALHFTCCRSGS